MTNMLGKRAFKALTTKKCQTTLERNKHTQLKKVFSIIFNLINVLLKFYYGTPQSERVKLEDVRQRVKH